VQSCRVLDNIEGIGMVHLSEQDIVRHRLVRSIVAAYEADRGARTTSGDEDTE
jgi:phosphate starvation-inducible PhoH-like protein